MGWSGDFQIKYKGGSPKKFHKLAKMVIPNSLLRFDFDNANMNDNEVELACTRNLSWYSADKDMKKLLSYFKDGDSISMEIDGEGDYEKVDITKENGNIELKNSNLKSERYISKDIGIPEMLYEELSDSYAVESEELDICSLNGYVQFISNIFADDEEFIPIVQSFMYEVLDKDRVNSFAYTEEDKVSKDSCDKLDEIRTKFATVDSTRQFLSEQKNNELSFESNNKQDINSLPDWIHQYPKTVINALGGAALLKKLIDTKGEEEARSYIEMLGGAIMREMEDSYDDTDSFSGIRR